MSSDPRSKAAVVVEPGMSLAEVDAFAVEHGLGDAKRYSPHKLDDLNSAVVEGRITRVVFSSYGAALRGMWDGDVNFSRWRDHGVAVDFVGSAPANAGEQLVRIAGEWNGWVAARRRRNAIAGAVLSAFLLVAAFLIIAICGRPR